MATKVPEKGRKTTTTILPGGKTVTDINRSVTGGGSR